MTAHLQMSTCLFSFKGVLNFVDILKRGKKLGKLFWYSFISVLSQFNGPRFYMT
jgi:hypothetical protein